MDGFLCGLCIKATNKPLLFVTLTASHLDVTHRVQVTSQSWRRPAPSVLLGPVVSWHRTQTFKFSRLARQTVSILSLMSLCDCKIKHLSPTHMTLCTDKLFKVSRPAMARIIRQTAEWSGQTCEALLLFDNNNNNNKKYLSASVRYQSRKAVCMQVAKSHPEETNVFLPLWWLCIPPMAWTSQQLSSRPLDDTSSISSNPASLQSPSHWCQRVRSRIAFMLAGLKKARKVLAMKWASRSALAPLTTLTIAFCAPRLPVKAICAWLEFSLPCSFPGFFRVTPFSESIWVSLCHWIVSPQIVFRLLNVHSQECLLSL